MNLLSKTSRTGDGRMEAEMLDSCGTGFDVHVGVEHRLPVKSPSVLLPLGLCLFNLFVLFFVYFHFVYHLLWHIVKILNLWFWSPCFLLY